MGCRVLKIKTCERKTLCKMQQYPKNVGNCGILWDNFFKMVGIWDNNQLKRERTFV
jgi:hypothetical protein